MSETKQLMMNMVENLPDNATFEDLQYHIYVQEKIQRGLKAMDEGDVLQPEEFNERVKKWIIE